MTQTIVASVTTPSSGQMMGGVKQQLSLVFQGGFTHTEEVPSIDYPIEDFLRKRIASQLGHDTCHGYRVVYTSTATDDGFDNGGIEVWEYDFDENPPVKSSLPIYTKVEAHYIAAGTPEMFDKEHDYANETAISILNMAGFTDPDDTDLIGGKVSDELQGALQEAMMLSPNVSRTLFAAINDHIRELDDPHPTGSDDDLVLVCQCGEFFDSLKYAEAHFHGEELIHDESTEFDFRITTRGLAV